MKTNVALVIITIFICISCTQKTNRNIVVDTNEIITDGSFMVLEDKRVFCMMSFINAIGYDEEYGNEMTEARKTVRRMVNENLKSTRYDISKYKKIYKEQHIALYDFLDYALCLSNDYPFRQIRSNDELKSGKLLLYVYGNLPEILNDFYKNAKLDDVWKVVKPLYDEELHKYNLSKMNDDLENMWNYLKDERKDNYKLIMVPNLLDSHYIAIAAEYDNFYYSVQGIGSSTYGLNVHEYLHSYINGLVDLNIDNYIAKLGLYFNAGKSKPMAKNYQYFPGFVSECLVRALDNRIEKKEESIMDKEMEGGLLLVKPFFLELEKFEKQSHPFSDYIGVMFNDISDLY